MKNKPNKRVLILTGMPGSGKSFVAEKLRNATQSACCNTSDCLVDTLAEKKGLTRATILKSKEIYRPELIALGDKMSVGGNLVMHYIAKGYTIITGLRRIEELEAVRSIKNIDIVVAYIVSDKLCTPDNISITPSMCDLVLINPRIELEQLTDGEINHYFNQNHEFQILKNWLSLAGSPSPSLYF